MIQIAPSVLSANFAELGEELKRMERAGADWIHLDIMDGIFVPNLTFGPPIVKALRSYTKVPFDVHLMILQPSKFIREIIEAGADLITIHFEAEADIIGTLSKIRSAGVKTGLSIKPSTPPSLIFEYLHLIDVVLVMTVEPGFGGQSFMRHALDKIRLIREEANRRKLDILFEVDGGIDLKTIQYAGRAGVDIAVSGTTIFKAEDPAEMVAQLKLAGQKGAALAD